MYIDDVCLTPCGSSCTTGIDYPTASPTIILYPNPAKNEITIATNTNTNCTIELYNQYGSMLERQWSVISGQLKIDVKNYSAGVYYVKATSGKTLAVKKFVKQ